MKLVCLAAALAFPVGWWVIDRWLESFAYRSDLSFGICLGAGAIVTLVALMTIDYDATKATLMNPVDSLRSK